MAWENHVYYFGYWDRAAHTNIKEDRHLLSTLPSDWHADRGRLILSLSLSPHYFISVWSGQNARANELRVRWSLPSRRALKSLISQQEQVG